MEIKELNDQLVWICELLKSKDIPFWVDSGTLLGLVRDGRILKHDSDIDISLFAEHQARLQSTLPCIRDAGYKVITRYYGGSPYEHKLIPRSKGLKIDVKLFRVSGEYAWCPMSLVIPNPYRRGTLPWYLIGLPRYFVRKMMDSGISVDRWPCSNISETFTWWIKSYHFQKTTLVDELIPIPEDWGDYLKLRYGNWKVPNKRWYFVRDDGCLIHKHPDVLLADCVNNLQNKSKNPHSQA